MISVTGRKHRFSTPTTRKLKRDYAATAATLSAPQISKRLRNAAIATGATAGFYGLLLAVQAIEQTVNF